MSKFRLEGNLGVKAIRSQIATFEASCNGQTNDIQFEIASRAFLETGGIAQLTSWLLLKKGEGAAISLNGDESVISYLARMNFHQAIGIDEPVISRMPESGRFIPILLVNDGSDVFDAVNAIANIVIQQFEGVSEFIPAFEWAVNEIVDNVNLHAKSPAPGVVCAQLFPTKRKLDIAISDCGIGIRGSLSQSLDLKDDNDAIGKALERGVTRDAQVGQGNGMAGSLEIMRKNGGKLLVWSGSGMFRMESGEDLGFESGYHIDGTGVLMSFDLSHPVQLIETWIGAPSRSYIEAEADRISESGIRIIAECSHTGSRPPATRLRRKIQALLPEIDGALKIEFDGISVLTSSFLDELLGRLNAELGNKVFNEKIIVSGLTELHQNMANNVIGQRLALASTSATQKNAWLVIKRDELTLSKKYQIRLNGDPELFMAIKDSHWVLVGDGDGNALFAAKVLRVRSSEIETILYIEKSTVLSARSKLDSVGINVEGDSNVLRLDWQVFENGVSSLFGHGLEGMTVIDDAVYVRELMELSIRDDLLGPALGPNEIVRDTSVRARYLLGKLAPRIIPEDGLIVEPGSGVEQDDDPEILEPAKHHVPGAEFGSAVGKSSPEDDALDEVDTSNNQSLVPSSFGITFCVAPDVGVISVRARWGKYERVPGDDHDIVNIRKDKKTGEEKEVKAKVWQRVPRGGVSTISLEDGPINPAIPDQLEPEVRLQGTIRTNDQGDRIVTIFLVNAKFEPGENKDEAWLFQPQISIESSDGKDVFKRRPASSMTVEDEELNRLSLMYRNRIEFAVGHGVSVHVDQNDGVSERAYRISSEVMPKHEVEPTETPGLEPEDRPAMRKMISEGWLDMRKLANMSAQEIETALGTLLDDYDAWINEQQSRVGVSITGYDAPAAELISRCKETSSRLREGLAVLIRENDALQAFQFANAAMASQRVRSIYARLRRIGEEVKIEDIDVPKNHSWRAFQLAFLLLSIPSLTDPKHKDRINPVQAFADLLWFPTGGGKTEAYLGAAAFAMAIRRLKPNLGGYDASRGLAVIMRYTLRLLTLQQFQRATTLVCAMEMIRKDFPEKWGAEPFTLGLWVGNKVTPGTTADAHAVVKAGQDGRSGNLGRGSPHQLTSCPWCGSEIDDGKGHIVVDTTLRRTSIFCGDKYGQCTFSKGGSSGQPLPGLPVRVVDEEIYHRPPSMMIATVDKFAMMAWRPEVRSLFGRVSKECERHGLLWPGHDCGTRHHGARGHPPAKVVDVDPIRPPDLVIQDEFHLISGPLGTMVGLYETAVNELSSWQLEGAHINPKIVASTATVRRAEDQVRNVFMRRVSIFPPSGLDVEDNFFSVQRSIGKKYGRRYLGICAPGSSRPSVLIRVYTAVLTSAQFLFNKFGDVADPYMTLVGYFNSLRELGGMRRLAEDDVTTRAYKIEMSNIARPGLAQRKMSGNVNELTSRISSQEIPKNLDQLENVFVGKYDPGEDVFQADWESEKRPVDVVLATNMLSVGVDVDRLGVMVVNGQPKGTAEYIQATSRVGRSAPGIVFSVLTWARPRDLSHYENFEHYHGTFYQHVEAQSVTPFSPRAIDRGLTGAGLSLMRLTSEVFSPNTGAAFMTTPTNKEFVDVTKLIAARTWDVTNNKSKRDHVDGSMQERGDQWAKDANFPGRELVFDKKGANDTSVALMNAPGLKPWGDWTVPMSMREVEPGVRLILEDRSSKNDPDWTPKPAASDAAEENN